MYTHGLHSIRCKQNQQQHQVQIVRTMTPFKCFFASSTGYIWNLALRINHFRNAGAQDAEEFLSPAPRGNRCAWHSTKVLRDTLSYHPLSHQLNTQWKSCSTTSNTWTSERWLSVSPIFDISKRKTPGHWNETLNLGPISTLERGSEARWQVNSPPPWFRNPVPTNLPVSGGLAAPRKGGRRDLWP